MTKREAERQTRQADVLAALGFTYAEAEQLRRISLTLHRWFENECNGAIQRDGEDGEGRPYWFNTETGRRICPVPDRERGAMKRLKVIIDARNARERADNPETFSQQITPRQLAYYIQGDPRGASLYIIRPGDVPEGADVSGYYSRGVCVY